jgi:hypothetical protein
VVATGKTLSVPLAATAPVQPPLAVQAAALVLDQIRVEERPETIAVGLAEMVVVGAGRTVTVALADALEAPSPVQVSV